MLPLSMMLKHKRFVFIGVCVLLIVLQNGINTLVTVSPFSHYHCLPVANYFLKPVPHIMQHNGLCDGTNDIYVNDFPELLISGDSGSHAFFVVQAMLHGGFPFHQFNITYYSWCLVPVWRL